MIPRRTADTSRQSERREVRTDELTDGMTDNGYEYHLIPLPAGAMTETDDFFSQIQNVDCLKVTEYSRTISLGCNVTSVC